MLKLPKGLKKKKKKSKKDQELFTEQELEEYKRQLKAKQEAAAAKSDAGESDAASDVEGLAPTATTSNTASTSELAQATSSSSTGAATNETSAATEAAANDSNKSNENDDEWAKFKALTSGVDTILHKTHNELDRIKKESFYQRLPTAAEKKQQEEEEAARLEAERLEEEKRLAAEKEANRDKLAEAVVELSESEGEDAEADFDDLFVTEYVDAITSGELQLVVPDSPVFDEGPDPFDTAYADKVIVGADKAKGNKKLVSLGAAVEVLSGRVEREKALEFTKPTKRKLRKGIKNLLLSESVDQADDEDLLAPEPQQNLLDDLFDNISDVPDGPIDLTVSLHLSFIQNKKPASDDEEGEDKGTEDQSGFPDLSEFDTLKTPDDDEFAELAAESLNKKDEVKVITEIPLPKAELLTDFTEADWAEFEKLPGEEDKPKGPPPRPESGPHLIPGAIYVSDDEDDQQDDDPFNTSYAEVVIKKTTVLEEDDDFDPRAEETKAAPPGRPPPPAAVKLLAKHLDIDLEAEDFDPFDTTVAGAVIVLSKTTLKQSLSDPDFDPRAEESIPEPEPEPKSSPPKPAVTIEEDFDPARRKSSLSLSLQNKSVGFIVPNQDLLGAAEGGSNKKPLTPYYAPSGSSIAEKDSEDPFDTSYVPANKPTEVELKHLENDLLAKPALESDPDFDPRAPPTPVPAEDLLAVKDNINIKVLTPAQESKDLPDDSIDVDPFDTSIATNLQPGQAELKLLESELLPERIPDGPTDVLDIQSDAQELGLGDKVLTPQLPHKQIVVPVDVDPFDTSIAENLQPGETEIKLLESELIDH